MPDIGALQNFAIYMLGATSLFGLALAVYMRITPHAEIQLVREGNVAAAVALAGAALGLALPLASSVLHTGSFVEMIVWASVGVLTQLLAYFLSRFLVPALHTGLLQGEVAHGTVLAGFSVGLGLINAACIS